MGRTARIARKGSHRPVSYALGFVAALVLVSATAPAHATIEWVAIGDPGNSDDDLPSLDSGAVGYEYEISRYETTNAEYAAFLNAKAVSDPLELYNPQMGSDTNGGITRSGSPGSYTYAVEAGFEEKPVNFVSVFDALRFANWVGNGEGNGDTETGSYTLDGGTPTPSNSLPIDRNPGAQIVLPSRDEWHKAAYYDGQLGIYYDYPTGTDEVPDCGGPSDTPNKANCDNAILGVTEVGAYTASASPYGTFDQGGNVSEWNDSTFSGRPFVRGGDWDSLTTPLKASSLGTLPGDAETNYVGFRLVRLEAGPGGDPLDVAEISVLKQIERFDGVTADDPYRFEACVEGTGIQSAEVTPPGSGPMLLFEAEEGRYCLFSFFENAADLELAYPDGMYVFDIFGSQGVDSKTLSLQADEPGGYLEVLSPLDGASVPDDEDLVITWSLVEKANGAGCIAGMSCADEISAKVLRLDFPDFDTIVDDRLPLTATGLAVSASDLVDGAEIDAAIATLNGVSNPGDMTDMGDSTVTRAGYADLNRVFVIVAIPEPTAGLLNAAALLTLAALRRGRRGGR